MQEKRLVSEGSTPSTQVGPGHRRSSRLVIANGAIMQMAMSFASSDTVLPAFIQMVTGSSVMVGLAQAMMRVGWAWPQVFISRVAESQPRKMRLFLSLGLTRAGIWGVLALVTFLAGNQVGFYYLAAFFGLYAISTSLSGATNVPWMDIIGKSVAPTNRVRLFAMRRLVGGLLAMGSGVVISFVLSGSSGLAFPRNYAVLFLLSAVFTALAIGTFGLIRERIEAVHSQRQPLGQYLTSGIRLLRADVEYRRLFFLRYLWGAGMMGTAFYVPFAIAELGIGVAFVGLFVSVSQLSAFLSNALWAWVGDRKGNCALMVYGTWCMGLSVLVPILAPYVPDLPIRPLDWAGVDSAVGTRTLFFSLAFLFQGFAHSGTFTGRMAFILDIAPPDRRPTYTAFMNTFGLPQAVLPIVAGSLAAWLSYPTMFAIALIFTPPGLLLAVRLNDRVVGREGSSQGQ